MDFCSIISNCFRIYQLQLKFYSVFLYAYFISREDKKLTVIIIRNFENEIIIHKRKILCRIFKFLI